jgi:hypothetical protein
MLRQQAQGASTKAGQSDLPDAGGKSDLSSATPGIGSVSELMSNPSTASLGSLAGLGQMLDSTIGRGVLGFADLAIGQALTPSTGLMGPVGGLMATASALSPTISKGFDVVNNVATTDAKKAKDAALSIEYDLSKMSPAEITDLNTYAQFNAISNVTGYDPTVDPAVSAVGMTSQGVPGFSVAGTFGATYGWNDELGECEVVADKLTPTDVNKAKTTSQKMAQNAKSHVSAGFTVDEVEDEDDIADIDDPGFDQSATTAPDFDPNDLGDDAQADAEADVDDAEATSAEEAGAGDGSSTGDDSGNETEDGDDGAEGVGAAKGGLIKRKPRNKKRGGRKRKKRGGLGSRK